MTAWAWLAAAALILAGVRFGVDRFARAKHIRVRLLSHVLPGRRAIGCARCRTSWRFVRPHATPYQPVGSRPKQIAPLCDLCWMELAYPAARIGYYHDEVAMRVRNGDDLLPVDLIAIRAAVAAGL